MITTSRSRNCALLISVLLLLVMCSACDAVCPRPGVGPLPDPGTVIPNDAVFCVGEEVNWADVICTNDSPAKLSYWSLAGAYDKDYCDDPVLIYDNWCAEFTISGVPYHSVPGGKIVFDGPGVGTVTANMYDIGDPGKKDPGGPWPAVEAKFSVVRVTMTNPHGDAPAEGANQFTFNSANPGICNIQCLATVEPDNAITRAWAKEHVSWSILPGVVGSSALWSSDDNGSGSNKGLNVNLQYTGLPDSNTSFGNNTITMIACPSCPTQQHSIQIFYRQDATNHPSGDTTALNWHHYYSQTPAGAGVPFDPTAYGQAKGGYAKWDPYMNEWVAFLDWGGNMPINRPSWGSPQFIDSFAWLSRHELRHVAQMVGFWGNNDRDPALDVDGDSIPDILESTYGRGYSPFLGCTYPDEVGYGVTPIPDAEDICMRGDAVPWSVIQLWENDQDSIIAQDWANFGKQHSFY
ncbi:MAG: hypothetical protein ACOX3G_06325 [Armatimonadota bacterium]